MNLSIICPNISSNALGRAHLLYKMLQKEFEVEIIGPGTDGKVWGPLRSDTSINIRIMRTRDILKNINGDIIYASKPLLGSFGIGILAKFRLKKKLILDIDDWQLGFVKEEYSKLSGFSKIVRNLRDLRRFYWIDSFWNNYLCEKMVFLADSLTVSNSFLKDRFGGELIRHTRDADVFDPEKFNRRSLRNKLGIGENEKIVIFPGTRRPHKGIEGLIDAISSIEDKDLKLYIMGSENNKYSVKIDSLGKSRLGSRYRGIGIVQFDKIPEYLSVSDLVVIPQKKNFSSIGQFPVKIFDAMSMGRPILTTNVSDMDEIIGDAGWVINSGDVTELKNTVNYIINNPDEAEKRGKLAGERFRRFYSINFERARLVDLVNNILRK